MSRELPADIRTAIARLRDRHSEHCTQWVDAFVALGRAHEAACSGDTLATALALRVAADHEYDLMGDCDTVGRVLQAMGDPGDA